MPKSPAASAEVLLQEALTALDACFKTLARLDERIRGLVRANEADHRAMQRHLNNLEPATAQANEPLPMLPDGSSYTIDHEAIYSGELALRREIAQLRALHNKLDYLTNLVRASSAQLTGNDDASADVPWAAAVQAARVEAQEEERMRLAREVHDGPAQVLANAIIGLEYCQIVAGRAPAELDAEMQRLRDSIRSGLVDVRRFMFDLRPTMLATMGLNATIRHYVEDFRRTFNLTVDLVLPREELVIEDRAQIAIFRIVQESLQNIQKHAEASRIQVKLNQQVDGAVRLTVSDDGKGFDPAVQQPTARSGAGLLGMRERASILGGTLTVTSSPAGGTVVALLLPSPSAAASEGEHAAAAGQETTPADRSASPAGGEPPAAPAMS